MSRSVNPAVALAGFGVALSLCGVLYSPLLVGQQVAATKLLSGSRFGPIQRLWFRIGIILSLVAVAVGFSPVGVVVFSDMMGVSGDIFDEARAAMVLLAPVPLLTALRAVHQGRLVAGHRTNPIALATGARTAVIALVAVALTVSTPGGAWVGAAAFTLGLLAETILVTRARAGTHGAYHPVAGEGVEPIVTDDRLLRFSTPLMLNVLLWWSTPVLINSVLARSPFPAEAIAAFLVVEAVAWFLASPVGQYQFLSIGLVDCRRTHRAVRKWSLTLAAAVALNRCGRRRSSRAAGLCWVPCSDLTPVFSRTSGQRCRSRRRTRCCTGTGSITRVSLPVAVVPTRWDGEPPCALPPFARWRSPGLAPWDTPAPR